MKNFNILILLFSINGIGQILEKAEIKKNKQDSLINLFASNCASNYNYNYEMEEWQNCLDEGLKKDSTVAKFWQMKAMPYFKSRKYEIGMQYIDKAVLYDPKEWQPYRAFIKCIFAKTYREAIIDFEDCVKKFGNNYVMDHTYNFYIGLSYLQLNEYEKAEKLFKEYNDDLYRKRDKLEHPTALFYYGIALYEQKKYKEAIVEFDKALKIYTNYSDAKCYKAYSLNRLAIKENINKLFDEAEQDFKKGYKISEYNSAYETYPYQVKWEQ